MYFASSLLDCRENVKRERCNLQRYGDLAGGMSAIDYDIFNSRVVLCSLFSVLYRALFNLSSIFLSSSTVLNLHILIKGRANFFTTLCASVMSPSMVRCSNRSLSSSVNKSRETFSSRSSDPVAVAIVVIFIVYFVLPRRRRRIRTGSCHPLVDRRGRGNGCRSTSDLDRFRAGNRWPAQNPLTVSRQISLIFRGIISLLYRPFQFVH